MWASGNRRGEVGGSHKKFSRGEVEAKGRVRLPRSRGSAELGKVGLALLHKAFG